MVLYKKVVKLATHKEQVLECLTRTIEDFGSQWLRAGHVVIWFSGRSILEDAENEYLMYIASAREDVDGTKLEICVLWGGRLLISSALAHEDMRRVFKELYNERMFSLTSLEMYAAIVKVYVKERVRRFLKALLSRLGDVKVLHEHEWG